MVFGPNIHRGRFCLFHLSIRSHFIVLRRRRIRIHFTGRIFLISSLLLVQNRTIVATFCNLIGLPMATRRLRPLNRFLPMTSPNRFPCLICRVKAKRVGTSPFRRQRVGLTIYLLRDTIHGVCFRPIKRVPFVAGNGRCPFLLPSPCRVKALCVP